MREPRGLLALAVLAGCALGDDLPGLGPPLAQADLLAIVAHLDDDMLFMQPELATALARGSVTTVYVLSGDPVHGAAGAAHTFAATMTAYEHAAGSSDWECGYITVAHRPAHHCRLRDRPVSMIGLDIPDGGRYDEREASLVHLVQGIAPSLPLLGPFGGRVTMNVVIDELAEIITASAPGVLHTLDLSATHGDDHPGHLMVASFALWGAASARYAGTIVSHRGYSVTDEPATLSDADYALAKPMMGYFEACYRGCAPCGQECATLDDSHETWLRRQYSTVSRGTVSGQLASAEVAGACLAVSGDGGLGLADCGSSAALQLGDDQRLHAGTLCATTAVYNDEPLALAACADDPAQYWRIDDEGLVSNGSPPRRAQDIDMQFDHVRCLAAGGHGHAGSPVCGRGRRPRWHVKKPAGNAPRGT